MKRILSLFLALACAALLVCSGIHTAWAAGPMASNGKPYYIMVNRAQSTVTVYELDEEGYYTVPVKAMVCSTGRKGHATPTGTFTIGGRWTWVHMLDDSYGQYCTQIKGNILFHSVCYTKRDPSTLMTEEYNGLGAPASLGCVRLQTADAKWIYDNCARGTKVTVYDADDPGPLGKPGKLVERITEEQANGWDPTDPREDNPWHELLASDGQDPDPAPSPSAGPDPAPAESAPPAGSEPQPLPEEDAVTYAQAAQALYGLSGETDLTQGADPVLWAAVHQLLDGVADGAFDPQAPISRQDLTVMLYQYETAYCQRAVRRLGSIARFADWPSIGRYARVPVRWATGNGLIRGVTGDMFQPGGHVSRSQLDELLQRYAKLHP